MLIHAVEEGRELAPDQESEVDSLLQTWLEETIGRKVNLQGNRLCPSTDATTVRVRAAETLVTDGPFAETKEQVAGYDILECQTLGEAVKWASKHPVPRLGTTEVRPLMGDPIGPLPQQKPGTTRYLMLVCVGDLPAGAVVAPVEPWVDEMYGRGTAVVGQRLEMPSTARTVQVRDGRTLFTDGPFAETKEMIAGFDVLDCADLDEAIDVAAKHPIAPVGSIELRPFWPFGRA